MAVREDLVASAVQFLRDPSVGSSPMENRVAFLQAKNLTDEEIDVAMARVSTPREHSSTAADMRAAAPRPGPQYYQPYPVQYPWQQPPPPPPRRDWRDWFIMATMVSGVGYGVYTLAKRYVYPMIAPPTPERLEQDKKSIKEQFDKVFSLVEKMASDTEAVKAAEKDRTERLDAAMEEMASVLAELKMSNRRLDDDTQRLRQHVQALQDSIPSSLDGQKEGTDQRLKELNKDLVGLKTLIQGISNPAGAGAGSSTYMNGIGKGQGKATAGDGEGSKAAEAADAISAASAGVGPLTPQLAIGSPSTSRSIPSWQRSMALKGSSEAGDGSNSS